MTPGGNPGYQTSASEVRGAVSPSPGGVSNFPKGNQELHNGNPSSRAGPGGSPCTRRLRPSVSRHFKASSGGLGPLGTAPWSSPLPELGFTRAPTALARPALSLKARHLATVATTRGLGRPNPGADPSPFLPRRPWQLRQVRGRRGGHSVPGGGHSPLPLFVQEGRCWGSFPPPSQTPAGCSSSPSASGGSCGLLHSLIHPRALTGWSRRREGGEDGRDWGGRVRDKEKDRKTGRPGHYVTSCWFGRGGAGTSLASAPFGSGGGGVTSRGRGRRASSWRYFQLRFP